MKRPSCSRTTNMINERLQFTDDEEDDCPYSPVSDLDQDYFVETKHVSMSDDERPYSPTELFCPASPVYLEPLLRTPPKTELQKRVAEWVEDSERSLLQSYHQAITEAAPPKYFHGHPFASTPRVAPLSARSSNRTLEDPRRAKYLERFRRRLDSVILKAWREKYVNEIAEADLRKELKLVVENHLCPLFWRRLILFTNDPTPSFEEVAKLISVTPFIGKILQLQPPEVPALIPLERSGDAPIDVRLSGGKPYPRSGRVCSEMKVVKYT